MKLVLHVSVAKNVDNDPKMEFHNFIFIEGTFLLLGWARKAILF